MKEISAEINPQINNSRMSAAKGILFGVAMMAVTNLTYGSAMFLLHPAAGSANGVASAVGCPTRDFGKDLLDMGVSRKVALPLTVGALAFNAFSAGLAGSLWGAALDDGSKLSKKVDCSGPLSDSGYHPGVNAKGTLVPNAHP
jgi:hypothetical protein